MNCRFETKQLETNVTLKHNFYDDYRNNAQHFKGWIAYERI